MSREEIEKTAARAKLVRVTCQQQIKDLKRAYEQVRSPEDRQRYEELVREITRLLDEADAEINRLWGYA